MIRRQQAPLGSAGEPAPPDAAVIVTADDHLLDGALRWCAAAGIEPSVVPNASAAVRPWRTAGAIVVGADQATSVARLRPARRSGVVIITGEEIPWSAAVELGAEEVIGVDHDPERVIDLLRTGVDGRREACVLAVVGACGGAGASTIAAGVARQSAARGWRTFGIDADPYGGGWDLVWGAEAVQGARWPELTGAQGGFSGRDLREAVPEVDGVAVVSWDRSDEPAEHPDNMAAVIDAARRSHDLVVVDLDRSFGACTDVVLSRTTATLVVVPEEVRALAAARRVVRHIRRRSTPLVVTRLRHGGVDPDTVEATVGSPVLARIKNDRSLVVGTENGDGPCRSRTLTRASMRVLDAIGLGDV